VGAEGDREAAEVELPRRPPPRPVRFRRKPIRSPARAAEKGVAMAERSVLVVVVNAEAAGKVEVEAAVAVVRVEAVDVPVVSQVRPDPVEPSLRVGTSGPRRLASCGTPDRNSSSMTRHRSGHARVVSGS
jgi:hypothetical protein